MSVITECLVKTLDTKNTKVFVIKNNNRYLLFESDAKIDIYRKDTKVSIMNGNITTKKYYFSIIVCGEVIYKQEIDLKDIQYFEISTEVLTEDKSKLMIFRNISQIDTDEHDDWRFEITDFEDTNKLLSI